MQSVKMEGTAINKEEWLVWVKADLAKHNKGAHSEDILTLGDWLDEIGERGEYGWHVTTDNFGDHVIRKNV